MHKLRVSRVFPSGLVPMVRSRYQFLASDRRSCSINV